MVNKNEVTWQETRCKQEKEKFWKPHVNFMQSLRIYANKGKHIRVFWILVRNDKPLENKVQYKFEWIFCQTSMDRPLKKLNHWEARRRGSP